MAAYLLNLAFGRPAAATLATGLFDPDNAAGLRSKVWYTIPAGWPTTPPTAPGPVNQSAPVASWPAPVPDSQLSCALGDDIYIRLVPDSGWGASPPSSLGYAITFGRPATSNHGGATIAAPFVESLSAGAGMNTPSTFFVSTGSGAGPDGSWIFYLGRLAQNAAGQAGSGSSDPSRLCTYSFIVGAGTQNAGGNTFSWGHDPSIVVKG